MVRGTPTGRRTRVRLALEEAPAGTRLHGVAEGAIPLRDIAAVIGRQLNVPVTAITGEEAEGHFTWMALFAQLDSPAASDVTRRRFGWQPEGAGTLPRREPGHTSQPRTAAYLIDGDLVELYEAARRHSARRAEQSHGDGSRGSSDGSRRTSMSSRPSASASASTP